MMAVAQPITLMDAMIDFVASLPSLQQIITYKVPEVLDERLHWLLDKQTEAELSVSERVELDDFLRMVHFIKMLQLKARLKLA